MHYKMDKKNIKLPSNRKFGLFFGFIFFILALYFFWKEDSIFIILFSIFSLTFILLAIFKDSLLFPFNKIWMRFGMFLGSIVRPIVLAVLFFGLFAPLGILMRVFGRDELRLKSSKTQSFWKQRENLDSSKNFFNQQF